MKIKGARGWRRRQQCEDLDTLDVSRDLRSFAVCQLGGGCAADRHTSLWP